MVPPPRGTASSRREDLQAGTHALDAAGCALTAAAQACGGRGLVAQHDLPAGTAFITIPKKARLSARSSQAWPLLQPHATSLEPADLLVLAVAWEMSCGAASRWAPYLDFLGMARANDFRWCPQVPLFWGAKSRSRLRGTEADDDGHEKAALRENFNERVEKVARSMDLPGLNFETYCKIGAQIRGYGFWEAKGRALELIPVADLLNHHMTDPNCSLCDDSEPWQECTTRRVRASEELFYRSVT